MAMKCLLAELLKKFYCGVVPTKIGLKRVKADQKSIVIKNVLIFGSGSNIRFEINIDFL